jgi:hypothetical protein
MAAIITISAISPMMSMVVTSTVVRSVMTQVPARRAAVGVDRAWRVIVMIVTDGGPVDRDGMHHSGVRRRIIVRGRVPAAIAEIEIDVIPGPTRGRHQQRHQGRHVQHRSVQVTHMHHLALAELRIADQSRCDGLNYR